METPKKTYSKQGGRPKVGIGRICKYVVSTRLSPERKLRFSALCREARQPPAEVLRQLIDRGTVRARITREQLDFMAQLKGVARNLNQLTRLANAKGLTAVSYKSAPALLLKVNGKLIQSFLVLSVGLIGVGLE